MHKVFISYHHANDQQYKEALLALNERHKIFIDGSVDTGDIDENLDDQNIRETIRDRYLQDTSVTILLCGTESKRRKHIDWEIYSSMYNGVRNKQSGILVINLPSTNSTSFTTAHGELEQKVIYPDVQNWTTIDREERLRRYPHMPNRILDNMATGRAKISVATWERMFGDPESLRFLIHLTFQDRAKAEYDLSERMRRNNS